MNDIQKQVKEFHEKFGAPVRGVPLVPSLAERKLRCRLILEEVLEFIEASGLVLVHDQDQEGDTGFEICESGVNKPDIAEVADAIGDINYVVAGAALTWGLDAEAIGNEVHRSNMTKLWPGGAVKMDAGGKILKPSTYSKPDFSHLREMATKGANEN